MKEKQKVKKIKNEISSAVEDLSKLNITLKSFHDYETKAYTHNRQDRDKTIHKRQFSLQTYKRFIEWFKDNIIELPDDKKKE